MPKASFLPQREAPHFEPSDLSIELRDIVEYFQSTLYLPDPAPVLATLATYASFRLPGRKNPLWLMVVGGSSSGKTEAINALGALPHLHWASELSLPGLLSASPRKERHARSTGGLLRQIGDYGFVAMKDFTSILSLANEKRLAVLGALREIYDGHWTRVTGGDGGSVYEWRGHMGLVAGVTSAIIPMRR